MRFLLSLLLVTLSLVAKDQHDADKALSSLMTLINAERKKKQIDSFFMEPSESIDLKKLLSLIERLESQGREEVEEGPVVFYPLTKLLYI